MIRSDRVIHVMVAQVELIPEVVTENLSVVVRRRPHNVNPLFKAN